MGKITSIIAALVVLVSCTNQGVVRPKPRCYPRIDFPAHAYHQWDSSFCPLVFDIPDYCSVERKTEFFDKKVAEGCWFNLQFNDLNGTLHCTYSPIRSQEDFDKYKEDAFKMVDKHNIKANFIDRIPISNKAGTAKGFVFKIDGPVASAFQFYLSDEKRNFFRASLYFHSRVNIDSMKPVEAFVEEDVNHLIQSLDWKD